MKTDEERLEAYLELRKQIAAMNLYDRFVWELKLLWLDIKAAFNGIS